ncbi:hypothetical protein Cfor_08940 [Coptotermes formosanus]|uniref:Transmembrane protein 115 n=1 Tax=Coptotermes formosanus TaxID=36987 RepID=A0A6L2PPX1_COPFO|nr:hypothetical protein Cfor_08940 [Coptotermes formosanus]
MASVRGFSKNIPFIRQQFLALLGNTSASVKFICIVVLCSYFLSFSDEAVRVLSVTPGYLLPPVFWIWTAFTYCFLEIHFWEVCVDIITVGLCGKLIEPLWGALEMMTFFAVVNMGVAVLSAFFYLILYVCTFNTDLLFSVHIHGLAGYIAGVSVAVKQIMPDHMLVKTPLGKLTNRNIPLSVFFMSLIFWLIGLLEGTYPTMFLSGLLISWNYLRFYQYHSNGTRVHEFLVRIGICRRTVRKFDMAAAPTGITISLPGIDPHDMERRRLEQIALKALSERLSKVEPQPTTPVSWEQDQSKLPSAPSTSQAVAIAMPSDDTPVKPAVTSPAPANKMITVEAELAKT